MPQRFARGGPGDAAGDGAQPGDDIWVSGTLGDAALAVAAQNKRIQLKPA